MKRNYLEGVIDLHVHSWPDVRERKMSDMDLMEAGLKNGARAIVIKNHYMPTAARAAMVNRLKKEKYGTVPFDMYGGLALNQSVGGLNPYAVEYTLKMGGKIVWLPTFDSEFTMKRKGKAGGVICVRNGKAVDEMKPIFQLIKDHDAALATGHISPEEIFVVAEAAKDAGIRKIIVSHPESNLVGMTLKQQKRAAEDYGVFLEHCYAQPVGGGEYKKNLETNLEAVKEIGAANTIIATDSGQVQNPYWYESLSESIQYLEEHGISREDLDRMTKENPAYILGIKK